MVQESGSCTVSGEEGALAIGGAQDFWQSSDLTVIGHSLSSCPASAQKALWPSEAHKISGKGLI